MSVVGWTPGTEVDDWLKCCSWFDGDIGQLKTMLYEACEELDKLDKIVRNKHSTAATGTQQPCNLSPIFKLIKLLQSKTTATDDKTVGLRQTINSFYPEPKD